ncbi:MAG: hypothetical protein U0R51_02610 [Solirubrobacterales bacterium]
MAVKKDSTDVAAMRKLDAIAVTERRRRFRETTMSERLEAALELSDLAVELRDGVRRAAR